MHRLATLSRVSVRPIPRFFCAAAKPQVDVKLVKTLRELTGAPMADCKAAIVNSQNEPDVLAAASTWLRKLGKTQQTKKAGRATTQGLVGLYVEGTRGVLAELNCETDFVAQNTTFHTLLRDIMLVAGKKDVCPQSIMTVSSELGKGTIADQMGDAVNTLRENIQLARISVLQGTDALGAYMHQTVSEVGPVRLGKIGCLVSSRHVLRVVPPHHTLQAACNTIAMHAAAASPKYLGQESVPADVVRAEVNLLKEQATLSGKGPAHIDGIVAGRLRKFYEDMCLLNQKLLVTEGQELVSTFAKDHECDITGFVRFQVGEAL